jgi:hypothetical protein
MILKIYLGKTCDISFDICNTNPCVNGETCSNLGNGLFVCACQKGFTGSDCSIAYCAKDSCFNGGKCLIENNAVQCKCPCGYTGRKFELSSLFEKEIFF